MTINNSKIMLIKKRQKMKIKSNKKITIKERLSKISNRLRIKIMMMINNRGRQTMIIRKMSIRKNKSKMTILQIPTNKKNKPAKENKTVNQKKNKKFSLNYDNFEKDHIMCFQIV